MKKLFPAFLLLLMGQAGLKAQENYCDFESIKNIYFPNNLFSRTGILDSSETNPMPNVVNLSSYCAKYTRDTAKFDYMRIYTFSKMVDVTPYATTAGTPPKIKMTVYTSAPVGTIVMLQLGISNVDNYPAGIHSEYTAQTTVQNAWQELTFDFVQMPAGSMAQPTDIDKLVLLFNPNSNTTDTYYFDDIMGPNLVASGIAEMNSNSIKLLQNSPNPARDNTTFTFQTNSSGYVSLKIYDLMGNVAATVLEQHVKPGVHSIPVETSQLAGGIYFYVLKSQGVTRTRKMVIDN